MYHILDPDELRRQHQPYSESTMAVVSANNNAQENETRTPVSMSIGNDDQPTTYNPIC